MVNLAKLRKKAKEKKGGPQESGPQESGPQASGLGPREEPASMQPEARGPRPEASSDKIAKYLETAGAAPVQAKKEEIAEPAVQLELLTFVIAGEHYAIDIENVVEIVTPRAVTRIPNADPSVLGVLSLRGTIVMLVDARRRLHHPPAAETDPDTRIIVMHHESDNIGFVVDRVLRVVKIDASEVEPHPVVHSSEQDESVRGVFRHAGALTILLDLSKLIFTRVEWN
ncbi:MAG TPA: chemotaxis protein CheW [Thermoanaerobaculia bacterium]|nr:chemotaxis protein CheW [Thermoanaerobaculia bacterium]